METLIGGIIINVSPDPGKIYVGAPSIVILSDGHYIVSHNWSGPGTTYDTVGKTSVFLSKDQGRTWKHLKDLEGQFWSNLFIHYGTLYIMGTSAQFGSVVIRRSTNGGKTWTTPTDGSTGLLLASPPDYHTAPVPVVVHKGRIWRAMEIAEGGGKARESWPCFVMSVPVEADLLNSSNWTNSNVIYHEAIPEMRWLEGNVVVTPENNLVNILRTNKTGNEKAAVVHISDDGKTLSFDAEKDIIDFPGGGAKFTIRYDDRSKRYWSVVNYQKEPDVWRNILALTSSADLTHWIVESILLRHEDSERHAWQYIDWQFEGDDIIFVSRTAWGYEGTRDINKNPAHNANHITFHRISDFRKTRIEY